MFLCLPFLRGLGESCPIPRFQEDEDDLGGERPRMGFPRHVSKTAKNDQASKIAQADSRMIQKVGTLPSELDGG